MHEKSRYREPRAGDMATIRHHGYVKDSITERSALILSYASSNVYEPASCEVYCDGDIFWVEAKFLTLHPRDSVD